MKYLFCLVVAVSTFFVGCILTRFRLSDLTCVPTTTVVKVHAEKRPLLDGIKETMRACGDGYVQVYALPNGQKMSEGNDCHSSFKKARREMDQWLKTADRIIERSGPARPKRSERIVASFPKDRFGNEWVRIMWVHGECVHWISGPTLEHALEFEKSKLNPYKFEE